MRSGLLSAKTEKKIAVIAAILIVLTHGVLPEVNHGVSTVYAAPAEGALVRSESNSAVYYIGRDGKRYVFPNESTYFSWYHNFDGVQIIGDSELAALEVGRLIPVRPNVRFVRFDSEPKVYAVEPGGLLRWVQDESTFRRLGFSFDQVVTLPDVFRPAYTDGPVLGGAPNGVVVRAGEGGPLYYIRDGVRRPLTEEAMRQNRYFPNHVRVVSADVVASIPSGPTIGGFEQAVAGRPDDQPGAASSNDLPPEQPSQPATSTAPGAPRSFGAEGGSRQVTLNWAAPSGGGTVANYLLYRALAPIVNISGSAVTPIASRSASTTNYSDTGLLASTTYYYAVRVLGLNSVLGPYVTTSASTLRADAAAPPDPPGSLAAAGGSRQVALTWELSATSGVTGYAIFRSGSFFNQVNAAGVTAVATTSGSATGYTATNLASSTQYYFGVRARGGNGQYSALAVASATTLGSSQAPAIPGTPTAPVASSTLGAIGVAWEPPSSGGEVAGYQLLRSLNPISNPDGAGVTVVAALSASARYHRDGGLLHGTAYYYAVRAIGSLGEVGPIATVSAATPPPPLDRVLHLPEPPDNVVNADGLQWSMAKAAEAASLGFNKLMVPTRYYQGMNDLTPSYGPQACVNHVGRFCGPYNQFLSFTDTLATPDGRPVEVVLLTAKVTKSPMAGSDNQLKGAIPLQRMGDEPYDFTGSLSQNSGVLPPPGQGENRAFVEVNFSDPAERDRLLRLSISTSGDGAHIRWFPESWGTASFVDSGTNNPQGALGERTFDLPNPTVPGNRYLLMVRNIGTVPLTWQIQSLLEVDPSPTSIRSQDAAGYEWAGNTAAFTTYGYNHPRYALDETRQRFIDVQAAVWNEFSHHPSLVGLMGYGDEPHAMFWMPEDLARFQNAGHELAEFEKAVAAGQHAVTGKPFMLFGDPRDPTHNGISTGVYASNMAGGGFSDMASRFTGSEPIEWVLWGDGPSSHSVGQISGFTSQGFGVYLMAALYDSRFPTLFGSWVNAASSLPANQRERVRGWFYYAEQRADVATANLQAAVAATPGQLQ